MNAIVVGLAGAALGAVVGVFAGPALVRELKSASVKLIAPVVLAAVGFLAGYALVAPALTGGADPEADVEAGAASGDYEEVIADMRGAWPLIDAILAREPALIGELSREFALLDDDGVSELTLRQRAFAVGYHKVLGHYAHYIVRAADDDLIATTQETVRGLRILKERDPAFCFDYLYNPVELAGETPARMAARFGADQFDRQQAASAQLVRNAKANTVAYDVDAAMTAIAAAGAILRDGIGESRLGLLTGALVPDGEDEAVRVCEATAAMYEAILADADNRVAALRHMFSQLN